MGSSQSHGKSHHDAVASKAKNGTHNDFIRAFPFSDVSHDLIRILSIIASKILRLERMALDFVDVFSSQENRRTKSLLPFLLSGSF
jgi:hypothetical protein